MYLTYSEHAVRKRIIFSATTLCAGRNEHTPNFFSCLTKLVIERIVEMIVGSYSFTRVVRKLVCGRMSIQAFQRC